MKMLAGFRIAAPIVLGATGWSVKHDRSGTVAAGFNSTGELSNVAEEVGG